MKKVILFTSLILSALLGFSKGEPEGVFSKSQLLHQDLDIGIPLLLIYTGLILIIILLLFLIITFGRFSYHQEKEMSGEVTGPIKLFGIFEGDFSYVTSEYQDQVIHEYDGIQEYDNDLPPWWKVGFYITIVFGFSYFLLFHVIDNDIAQLQGKEYAMEMQEAEVKYANVDQVYEGPTQEIAELENANQLFNKSCKACHGAQGGGGVGPNLTDKYWLHGGNVNEVYHTIKYGVVEKGMKAWKSDYSNKDIYNLASYILTLQGTKPAGAKEPQGELVE